jgi:hypothetical protein
MEIPFRIRISNSKQPEGTICTEMQAINLSQASREQLQWQLLAADN